MDGLIAVLILLALALPVAAIAGLIMALSARDAVRRLEGRVAILERMPEAGVRSGTEPTPQTPASEAAEPAPTPPPQPAPAGAPAEPAAAQSTGPAPAEPIAPLPDTPPQPDLAPGFEERFGTRWVVWAGGIALVLGGVLLVRYSIEQGLVGPRVRMGLGALLAAALAAAGEWTRRRQRFPGGAAFANANIPSVLTAAGTTVAYATIYAAYGLYGLLPPGPAFVLLGAAALVTLAAALLHGPALAALGLVGANVAPLLVASDVPNFWALYVYLAVVTAATFTLARVRLWRWLAATAIVLGALWLLPGLDAFPLEGLAARSCYAAAGFALVAAFIVPGLIGGPQPAAGRIDGLSSAGLGAYLAGAAVLVIASHHDPFPFTVFAVLSAAAVAIAWRAEAATAVVPVSGAAAALVIAHWAVTRNPETALLPGGPASGAVHEPDTFPLGSHLAFGAGFAVLFGLSGFFAQGRSERASGPLLWAGTAVTAPLAILAATKYGLSGFDRSVPFAGMALLLAALYGAATEQLTRRETRPGLAAASAIFAAGSIAALALALTLALEKGWLTVGLALMAPGAAWVADQRPLRVLRWVAATLAAAVVARIGWEPRIVGDAVGTTPIFNWLLYGYGIPAAAFWLASYLLRQRADDRPARTVEAAAVTMTVLLAFTEIRHAMTGGDIYRPMTGLAEIALQVCVGVALAIGLERIRARTASTVHDIAALLMAGFALIGIVGGLWTTENPLIVSQPVGGRWLNLVLLGYGLPAILVAALALVTRETRPLVYRGIAVAVAVASALGYLTLEVSRLYQGPVLDIDHMSQAEQYTHSVAWLALGVALLLAGIALRSQPVRLASAAVITATVAKVFLVDLANLQGVLRALSFIGLGLALVGIGFLYQRLLFPPRAPTMPSATASPPAR
jgi:uncharacterized membrane protein